MGKLRLISKFMASQLGKQMISIHLLPNISRSKGNQAIIFGQLIECNMRNIFPKKSYTKHDGETNPRPFAKKLKLSISPNQQSKVFYSLFLLYVQVEGYRNIKTKVLTTCFYIV